MRLLCRVFFFVFFFVVVKLFLIISGEKLTCFVLSRELIAGADALKNVAQILEYIDRISEIKER